MPIPNFQAKGLLPVGRYACSDTEISERFVTSVFYLPSSTRTTVWSDYQLAKSALDGLLPVIAAWIGGSFTTWKLNPDDIDVTFIIDPRRYGALSVADRRVVSSFATANALRAATGWRVDPYLLAWQPFPHPAPLRPDQVRYFAERGYWDDWWQRRRVRPVGSPSLPEDSVPARGYLEVTYRDYL